MSRSLISWWTPGRTQVSSTRKSHAILGWPNSLPGGEPGGTRVSQRDALFFPSLLLGPVRVEALPVLTQDLSYMQEDRGLQGGRNYRSGMS